MAILNNFSVPTDGATGTTTLMPKLAYRFRVTFTGMGGDASAGLKTLEMTRNVVSVGRPSLTHDEIVVDTYNSKIKLAGKHMWNDINVVLRDDLDSNVIKQIGAQMSAQVNHHAQSGPSAGADYKFSMKIEILDGNNGDTGAPNVLDTWELAGCYVKNVEYGELNYANSEVVQVTMSVAYDNAAHVIEGQGDTYSLDQLQGLDLKDATGGANP